MKKVMIIAETCKDGVGKHVADLVTHLNKNEFKIIVLHGTRRIDYYFEIMMSRMQNNVIFEAIPTFNRSIHPLDDLKAYVRINYFIDKYKPEIVHCHSSKAGVLGRIAVIGKSSVKKMLYTPHAYAVQNRELGHIKQLLYMTIEKLLSKKLKCLTLNVSNGEHLFALTNGIVNKNNSVVVYNAIDDIGMMPPDTREIVRKELGIALDETVVTCVARLYYQKNPDLFIAIASSIIKKNSNVTFLWVGEGNMLKNALEQTEHTPKIRFIGHRTDIPRILEASDIYLSTSRYEGMPYTLIEACRAALPIVATDIEGNNEVVSNDVNGQLFGIDAPHVGIKILSKLINSNELRKSKGRQSRVIYDDNFHIDKMVLNIESLYQ